MFLCPPCWARRQNLIATGLLSAVTCLALVGLVLIPFVADSRILFFTSAVLLSGAFHPLCVLSHEIGHALSSVALGIRVSRIALGRYGRRLFAFRLLGCQFEFRSIPYGGLTRTWLQGAKFARCRYFITVVCGPLVNFLMLLGALAVVAHWQMQGTLALLSLSFAIANLITLGSTVVPRKVTVDGRQESNDGLLMLDLLFVFDQEIDNWVFYRYVCEAAECRERADHAGAQKWLTEGLLERPGNVNCLSELAWLQCEIGQFGKARQSWAECLQQIPRNSEERPNYLNAIAWVEWKLGSHAELLEADRYSSEAVAAKPWDRDFKTTRGRVLIALGKHDEGLTILRQEFRDYFQWYGEAATACFLAEDMVNKGNVTAAHELLERARSINRRCGGIRQTQDMLDERIRFASQAVN